MLLLYQCLCLGGRMLSVWKGKGLFTVCRCRCVGLRGMHVGLAGWNGDAGENVTIRRLCILVEVAFVSSGWCASLTNATSTKMHKGRCDDTR